MTKHAKYRKDDLIVKATPLTVSAGEGGSSVYPAIYRIGENDPWLATCCAFSFDGEDYNQSMIPEQKYSQYLTFRDCPPDAPRVRLVGAPSASQFPEPVEVSEFIEPVMDAMLISVFGFKLTSIFSEEYHDVLTDLIASLEGTVDAEVRGLFTVSGPNDFAMFPESEFPEGVSLWGGDGSGGERSAGGGVSLFPKGLTILTFKPSHDALIVGATYSFDAAGANRRLPCMVKIGGTNAFPLPIFDGGGIETVKFPGRVHCQAGGTVTAEVAESNQDGGAVRIALLYAEV